MEICWLSWMEQQLARSPRRSASCQSCVNPMWLMILHRRCHLVRHMLRLKEVF